MNCLFYREAARIFGVMPEGDVTAFFTACIDETGDDSRYFILGGAFAQNAVWEAFDRQWGKLLGSTTYHAKDFYGRQEPFNWKDLKHRRFDERKKKILANANLIPFAIAIDRQVHKDIKARMRGMKGYRPTSDYGLCFMIASKWICHGIQKSLPGSKIRFVVEQGPYSDGAAKIYNDVIRSIGSWKPAAYAEMHAGFAMLPKGQLRGLDAADEYCYLALRDMRQGRFEPKRSLTSVRVKMDRRALEHWYQGMLKEKERRRDHAKNRRENV